jgi:hypothetical protein
MNWHLECVMQSSVGDLFNIPENATRLYLGIPDYLIIPVFGYGDNSGEFTVSVLLNSE